MKLLSTEGYKALTQEQMCEVCNGCGPASWKVRLDNMLGVNLFEPCAIHDYDYNIGGTKADRRRADVRFIVNIIITLLFENRSAWNVVRVPGALLWYVVVRWRGRHHFTFD